jgi:gamma-glutamyltranspeptidase/glutathione hydrolase
MMDSAPSWVVSKRPVISTRGVVAAQHRLAAEAGARILRDGGNAVDAAVAAALAVGVVEPWLSGIGGGGFMVVRTAKDSAVHGLDFGMVAPQRLDPSHYAITQGRDLDWFQWPKVEGDRNIAGYESICVPGAVAGFAFAAERFGRLPWRELVAPAIALAEAGMPVDWYASLSIAVDAAGLDACPESRAIFLPDGRAPVTRERGAEQRLANPALTRTLQRLATAGPRDFYEGEIARSIVADLAAGGCVVDAADLAAYQARLVRPATLDYRGTLLHAMPGLSGGPTYLAALAALAGALATDVDTYSAHARESGHPALRPKNWGPAFTGTSGKPDAPRIGPDAFVAYAQAISDAYAVRLETYGHAGATHDCTSHVSVIDADGNMASLTNTLLSRFGAKVTLPTSGILMNNGMMWFDPRPGRPNSIAAGQRPLANMSPVIATRDGEPAFAMGAAGGRQIVPSLVQLTSFLLDFGMSPEEAFHTPRLDASTRTILCNARMPADQVAAVAGRFPVARVEDTIYPVQFAVPNAVLHDAVQRRNIGMMHVTTPWPAAAAEDQVA